MRRSALPAMVLVLVLAHPAWSQAPAVLVDGRALTFDQPPVMLGGRILVPLRGIFEALGAEVRWDAPTRTVRATRGASTVVLPLGAATATVDGRTVPLDAPASTINGRTVVPLRFVAEALGAEVRWDAAGRRVLIAASGSGPAPEPPPAGAFDPALDLPRLQVGNQAGVLKVFDRQRKTVDYFRTLDDRSTARVTPEQRSRIEETLGIASDRVEAVAKGLMAGYGTLPRLPALALLGVLGSGTAEAGMAESLQRFLVSRVAAEKDNVLRRQALLSLALMAGTTPATVEAVLRLYETEDNLWVTFPVPMFFQFHAPRIRQWPDFDSLRARVEAVQSLYTAQILDELGPPKSAKYRSAQVTPLVESRAGQGLASVPPDLLDRTLLRQVSLRRNALTVLPPDMGKLRALRALDLAFNRLADLPASLASLSHLRHLDLRGNRFATFPAVLLSLPGLETLDMGDNGLTALPPDLASMTGLRVLVLSGNRLESLPPGLRQMRGLQVLELEGNPLPAGEIAALRQALPATMITP